MKIIHIINSLKKSGAEGNLHRLVKFHKKKYQKKIDIIVLTLIDNGFYETDLRKNGIKVFSLGITKKNNYIELIKKLLKFRKFIKREKPDIVQSWMYHSNFLSLFIPRIHSHKIFWNIRHSVLNLKMSKKTTILVSICCALFSRYFPKKIIYCSEKSIKFHQNKHFYNPKKTILIDNGFDEKTFFSSRNERLTFRKQYNLKKTDIVLGFAGRYTREKNISSLLLGFSKIIKNNKNVYLCMVGKNINILNKELMLYLNNYNIKKKVHLLNEQENLINFYNGIDLLLLTSHTESFPNVVAESMLCSTPVLSSDVGCSKKIIDNFGFIMKDNNYKTIFHNLKKSINFFKNKKKEWKTLKIKSQLKIKKDYSIEKMANSYFKTWNF